MRCKKHYTDVSSAIGVCACCLRERLLILIVAQEQSSSLATNNTTSFHHHSVSPYISHRKSDPNRYPPNAPRHHHTFSDQLSFQTPQLNPVKAAGDVSGAVHSNKKRSFIRFFSFPNIFRSKNRNPVDPTDDGDEATSSASWFSIMYNKRNRRKKTASVDETKTAAAVYPNVTGVRRQCGNRGMSPVRTSEYNEDELCTESVNGYESTESWKNTPRRTPAVKRGGGGGHVRNLSFCLSPLVRASPNRQRNNKGLQPDGGFSGEIRAPVKPHLSNTKSFCANRSRKLADFGRANLIR
uniref:uncharacterized protein LOC122583419 n=1 Tax=Erigeron canadensis TaxID=72917 RepID=UPI001CB8DCE9|nr:uncharacterized protein LOC122583419 [Erigeron canadensis]